MCTPRRKLSVANSQGQQRPWKHNKTLLHKDNFGPYPEGRSVAVRAPGNRRPPSCTSKNPDKDLENKIDLDVVKLNRHLNRTLNKYYLHKRESGPVPMRKKCCRACTRRLMSSESPIHARHSTVFWSVPSWYRIRRKFSWTPSITKSCSPLRTNFQHWLLY